MLFRSRVPDSEGGPTPAADATTSDRPLPGADSGFGGYTGGNRTYQRDGAAYEYPPFGGLSDLGRVEKGQKAADGIRFVLPAGKLPRGRWHVTVRVWDTTEVRGHAYPWVLKDPQHLLEERESWWVTVAPGK